MKVLFAVDGSPGSLEGLAQVVPLLSPSADQVCLVYAAPLVHVRGATADAHTLDRARQALATTVFDEARRRLPASLQTAVQTIIGAQDPRHGILVAAEGQNADLIVVGARGLGVVKRMLLGSVSRAIVQNAKVPVWVARPRTAPTDHPPRILLACESSETARPAADVLGRFIWPDGTNAYLLSVVMSMFGGQVPDWLQQQARSSELEAMARTWASEHDEEIRSTRSRLEQFARSSPPPLKSGQCLVAEGEPAGEILATITAQHVDLVVVGAYHKTLLDKLLGSTCEAVLNHAECSVLVVPHKEVP